MDEFSGNSVEGTAEVVSETVSDANPEPRKRRSTRIVQAVPLVVGGVDALGRPFSERTSSLIINCHGCRYQSKHYVLKNMWVTLEIPHPETGQPARNVRGRVAWIQRPRTVRQLFQIALELEIPGNVWGIAFPPEDWFQFHGQERAKAAAVAAAASVQGGSHAPASEYPPSEEFDATHGAAQTQAASPEAEAYPPLADSDVPRATPAGNLRQFPSPANATDASLQLARQMARLLADAKQQIQAEAREAAAQAVSAERRIDAAQWEQKISAAQEQLSRNTDAAIEKIQQEADARSGVLHNAALETLQADLPRWLAPQLEELTRDLTARLSQEALAQQHRLAQEFQGASDTLEKLCARAEQIAPALEQQAGAAESRISAHSEDALRRIEEAAHSREESLAARLASQLESFRNSAGHIQQQITTQIESARSAWIEHAAGEMEAARLRAQIAIDNALTSDYTQAAATLREHSGALAAELHDETAKLAASLRETVGSAALAAADSERRVAELRDSLESQTERLETMLARAKEASEGIGSFPSRIDSVRQQALNDFHAELDNFLSTHRQDLRNRSDKLYEEIDSRIRGNFEEASREALRRFSEEIVSLVQPHVSNAEEAIHRLAGGRSLLDAALTLQHDRIRAAADEAFAESLAQFRGNLGSVEQLLSETSETVTSRTLAELDLKIEEVKSQTVEDLLKTAEWYEKKSQTQIQNFVDKAGERASEDLRDKAAEVTAAFTAELNSSTHGFVNHARRQMDEVVRDSFDRARALFAEAAETTSAAFIDEIQRHAREELSGFEDEAQKASGTAHASIDAAYDALSRQLTAEQESFLWRFRETLAGTIETNIAGAREKIQTDFAPLLASWSAAANSHQAQMRAMQQRLSEEAAEHYRARLENVSNQWMLATVASLDHQSRDIIGKISAAAEEKLRDTCSTVFAGIGDSLRERLRQITHGFNVPVPPPPGG